MHCSVLGVEIPRYDFEVGVIGIMVHESFLC